MRSDADRALGMALRRLRRASGQTQMQVAQKLNTTQSCISAIESGERNVRYSDALLFAGAVHANPRQLYTELTEGLVACGWLRPDGLPCDGQPRERG